MIKIKASVYDRLFAQAEEAREQGQDKLADGILVSLGPAPEDEDSKYSHANLENDIYEGLWKLATHIIKYRDVNSVDAEKLNLVIESLAQQVIEELDEVVMPDGEPKLPGEM